MSSQTKTLGRFQAIALALSFIIGSGSIVLPILSLQIAGTSGSMHAWILTTILAIPLILIFYQVAQDPDFSLTRSMALVMGKRGDRVARFIVFAALALGMPAMVLSVSGILTGLLGIDRHFTGHIAQLLFTALSLNHLRPIHISTKVSNYAAGVLLLVLMAVIGFNLGNLSRGLQAISPITDSPDLNRELFRASSIAFFGYVGWESLSFFTHELKNPRQDLKWVYGASFVFVSILYLSIASVVSGAVQNGSILTSTRGILDLLPKSIQGVTSVAVILVALANLNAWVFAGIQQVKVLSPIQLKNTSAILVYYLIVSFVLILANTETISIARLFQSSNQFWLLVYGGILIYYFKFHRSFADRVKVGLGVISFILLIGG